MDAQKKSTATVYGCGLNLFEKFFKGSVSDFLDVVEEDLRRPRFERKRVRQKTLNKFVKWLTEKNYAKKTIRSYVTSVQAFAEYLDVPFSLKHVKLPDSVAQSKKFPWNLGYIWDFVCLMEDDLELQTFAVNAFQLGWGTEEVLNLTYEDIKREFESGIVPLCVDSIRGKTTVHSMSFVGGWGVNLLQKFLKDKSLKIDSPIFSLSQRTITERFRVLAEQFIGEYTGRNPARPHSLRAAFRTLLSEAGLDRDIVKFFMMQSVPEQDEVYHTRTRDGWRGIYNSFEWALTPEPVKNLIVVFDVSKQSVSNRPILNQ